MKEQPSTKKHPLPKILFFPPNRVWRTYPGGKTLDQLAGKTDPQDDHFPESWIGSTTRAVNKGREHLTEEGLSVVSIGETSYTLADLFAQNPLALLGEDHYKAYGANTQFLLKFLDSAIRLHIQCHPTIPFAQKYLGSNSGKTEVYVILSAREEVADPYIYAGFQHVPTKEQFKQIIEEQDTKAMLACFEKIPVKPGDVFIVPGGMPHAIGEGVFLIEVMEPTDFTVRVEFERGGYVLPEASRFMDKGIDFALSMFEFEENSIEDIRKKFFCEPTLLHESTAHQENTQGTAREYSLIDETRTPCFSVNRLHLMADTRSEQATAPAIYTKVADSFYMGVVARGSGVIRIENEEHYVHMGDTFFIPYNTNEVTYESEDTLEVVLVFPPKPTPQNRGVQDLP